MTNKSPLAVYIHWPYCTRICPYCDFNVYKARGADNALLEAILTDLTWSREQSGPREVTSIHFGGGTPSLLSAKEISRLITQVDNLWGLSETSEIALEANPIDTDADKWRDYSAAGVKRLSLGVQTFHNEALTLLGRDHNADQAKLALDAALSIFPSVSADIIFGWAGQTQADLDKDLSAILAAGPQHISTYQLTIEPGTAFAKAEARGQNRAVGEDASADFFDSVMHRLGEQKFQHYEVSNFAKQGHESQHNLAYWRGYDYVGVGPGAHGRITRDGKRAATICALTPTAYINKVADFSHGIEDEDMLSTEDWAEEYLLMGLRIEEGISLSQFENLSGQALEAARYLPLIEDGFLRQTKDRLIATQKGRMLLNAVTEALLV